MQITSSQLRLYAITDSRWLHGKTLYACVEAALQGGITMLQIREKHCSTAELTELAIPIVSLCHTYRVPCIINDDVQAARDSGAIYGEILSIQLLFRREDGGASQQNEYGDDQRPGQLLQRQQNLQASCLFTVD